MSVYDERLVEFCRRLITCPSLPGKERDALTLVRNELQELGFDEVKQDEFGNVIGIIRNGEGPTIVFDAHLDTVGVEPLSAWTHDPFGAWIEEGRIYGRGAMDMKGQAAAVCYGLGSLVQGERFFRGTLIASMSVMEEVSEGIALGAVLDSHPADGLVIAEASSMRIIRAQRGRVEFCTTTRGRPSHSSTPQFGVDAVELMMHLVSRIKAMPMREHPILVNGVQALTDIISTPYPAMSTIPWECRTTWDRRLIIGETDETVLQEVQGVIDDLTGQISDFSAEVDIVEESFETFTGKHYTFRKYLPAWEIDVEHPMVTASRKALVEGSICAGELGAYHFCTNGSLPERFKNLPVIGFGPGDETLAHRKDEYIAIDDLIAGSRGYARIGTALSMALQA